MLGSARCTCKASPAATSPSATFVNSLSQSDSGRLLPCSHRTNAAPVCGVAAVPASRCKPSGAVGISRSVGWLGEVRGFIASEVLHHSADREPPELLSADSVSGDKRHLEAWFTITVLRMIAAHIAPRAVIMACYACWGRASPCCTGTQSIESLTYLSLSRIIAVPTIVDHATSQQHWQHGASPAAGAAA